MFDNRKFYEFIYFRFMRSGCDNCNPEMMDSEGVAMMTTTNFSGMISMMEPRQSWVGRYKSLDKLSPG